MNFEFESTFKKTEYEITPASGRVKRYAGRFLILNGLSAATLFSLYYNNFLIPAVYASGPNGKAWIKTFEISVAFWCVSNTCAIILFCRDTALQVLRKSVNVITCSCDKIINSITSSFFAQLKYFRIGRKNQTP